MISDNCPRLWLNDGAGTDQLYEAFALTYLSQYNMAPLSARTVLSHQRAFGCTSFSTRPRVGGGRPGYVITRYDGAGVNKVVVSIEGTSSQGQLWSSTSGALSPVIVTGLAGEAWGVPAGYAATMLAELLADDVFTQAFARPNTGIIFTGWSLGAAIAEILARRVKALRPEAWVECWKFGSPRVGDRAWREGNRRLDYLTSQYIANDVVQLFPANWVLRPGEAALFGVWHGLLFYVGDNSPTVRDARGDNFAGPGIVGNTSNVSLIAQYYRAHAPGTHWYNHSLDVYRAMFCELATWEGGLSEYRFRNLEYPNENSWQVEWRSGGGPPPDLRLIDPAPPEKSPPNALRARLAREVPPQVLIEQNQFDEDTGVGSNSGADWGGAVQADILQGAGIPVGLAPVPPSITWQRPRRTAR